MPNSEFKIQLPIGITLERVLKESDVMAIQNVKEKSMGNGYVWYTLPLVAVGNSNVLFSLCFSMGKFEEMNVLVVGLGSSSKSWNDWSEKQERQNAILAAKWLGEIGYPVGSYSWGKISAEYDPKGGFGCGKIKFAL
jgi:hypothetical protein